MLRVEEGHEMAEQTLPEGWTVAREQIQRSARMEDACGRKARPWYWGYAVRNEAGRRVSAARLKRHAVAQALRVHRLQRFRVGEKEA